jgi:alkylresorcinol/alkylpyrone synthase
MGCFGAITGLRSAAGTCAADPNAVVLVVCCELCTLHLRSCTSAQNQVASALFGDGSAAALVAGDHAAANLSSHQQAVNRESSTPSLGRLTLGHSRVIPETDSLMSWRITDAGFSMTLAREVPSKLRETVASCVCEACEGWPHAIVPHPGGPGVLDAVETALPEHLAPGVHAARSVLRGFGNMSSGTVLFVLERLLETDSAHRPALLLAFGPGLTIESIELRGPNHSPPPPVASQHIG